MESSNSSFGSLYTIYTIPMIKLAFHEIKPAAASIGDGFNGTANLTLTVEYSIEDVANN